MEKGQNLFLSEDQIKACMELLRKQITQEEKLEESWKNGRVNLHSFCECFN